MTIPSKFFAFLILIIISATLLLVALSPVIYIFIMNINLEIGGILLLFFNVLEFPITCILSVVTYKLIARKLNFPEINILLTILVAGIISSFTILWFPIFASISNYKTDQNAQNFNESVSFSLKNEEIVEVDNYTGDNPNKYEYKYQIDIKNTTKTTYNTVLIKVTPDGSKKGVFMRPVWDKYITIKPGINLFSGSDPIALDSDAKDSPKEISIELNFWSRTQAGINKNIYLKSKLQNWDKIVEEQKLFWKKYSTSPLNKK